MDFFRRREAKDFHNFEYEKFMPPFAWRDDLICHYLLLDLPGFSKEGLKIEVNDHDHVLVSGERQVSDDKMIHFEQSFKVPENSDIPKITGKYEGEVLYVVIPKKLNKEMKELDTEDSGSIEEKHEELKEEKNESNVEKDDKNDEKCKKQEEESGGFVSEESLEEAARLDPRKQEEKAGIVGSFSGMLIRNKGFIVSIILAFSLGVFVSRKFQSDLKNRTNSPIVV